MMESRSPCGTRSKRVAATAHCESRPCTFSSMKSISVMGSGLVESVRMMAKSERSLSACRVTSSCHVASELVPGVSMMRMFCSRSGEGSPTDTMAMCCAASPSVVMTDTCWRSSSMLSGSKLW